MTSFAQERTTRSNRFKMEQLTPRANESIALEKDYFGIGFEYLTKKK